MTTRRAVLKSLALSSGALIVGGSLPLAARVAMAQGTAPAPAPPPAPTGPFTLPPLPYALDALEPYLDAQTMQIHHDKHHLAYVNNLNKAVGGHAELAAMSVEDLVRGLEKVPAEVRTAIRNHGGGHANHSLLWTSLGKGGAAAPAGELSGAIDKSFGSFAAFQDKFNAAAMSVFGSGWAWLTWERAAGLAIETSPNQDSPLSGGPHAAAGHRRLGARLLPQVPEPPRMEYVAAFAKVVDWDAISARAAGAMKG